MGQARYAEAADAFLSCRNVFALARGHGRGQARDWRSATCATRWQALAARHALTADRFLEMQLEKRLAELQKRSRAVRGPGCLPAVTLALGTAYFQAGALEEAENELLAVLRDEPGSGDAENNLAVLYAATGRLDEAEAAMLRAEAGVRSARG